MPDITNPQAVKFCNEKARRLANAVETVRRTAEQFAVDITTEFEAHVGANDNGDVIVDGAGSDGGGVINKGDILALKYVCEQMVIALTANDAEAVVAKVSVNGEPLF